MIGLINRLFAPRIAPPVQWQYEAGGMILSYGHHEVTVKLNAQPRRVWVNPCSCGRIPVCHGDINMVGVQVNANSFILYADIATDSCDIEWVVEY